MGGQNSKLTPEAGAMPPKVRPLLQRKYEEIKSRIIGGKIKTHTATSKKELLKIDYHEEEDDPSLFLSSQCSPDHNNVTKSPTVQTTPTKKSSEVAPVSEYHDEIKSLKKEENKSSDISFSEHKRKESVTAVKAVPVFIGGIFAIEQGTYKEEKNPFHAKIEEEEEENEDEDDMRNIGYEPLQASPSFRIYCQNDGQDEGQNDRIWEIEKELEGELEKENENDKDLSEDDSRKSTHKEKKPRHHKKSRSANISFDSIPDNNEQDTSSKRKTRRRKMKNPFHMRGSTDCSVKSLWNARGCGGGGGAAAGYEKTIIVAEKHAAT